MLISSAAYLLVFHGSRDSRTQAAACELRRLLALKCQYINMLAHGKYLGANIINSEPNSSLDCNQTPLIEVAALELASIPLSQSLVDFAQRVVQQGVNNIKVIPLFLAPGVHVQQDLPAQIALATNQIKCQATIQLSPYLGKYSEIVPLLARKFAQLPAKRRILIAHGSKLPSVADYYQNLAQKLNADLGYWSTNPRFSQQIVNHIRSGIKQIALMPYFLFPGRITSAISQEIAALQQEYPQVELFLGQPLGATPALAELIAQGA
ncbi:MAG: CbiX/SirB N-terminal domain-containing protein [Cyanobacteria bacterium P01_A01_bin.83]